MHTVFCGQGSNKGIVKFKGMSVIAGFPTNWKELLNIFNIFADVCVIRIEIRQSLKGARFLGELHGNHAEIPWCFWLFHDPFGTGRQGFQEAEMDDVLVLRDFLAPHIQVLLMPLDRVAIVAVLRIRQFNEAYGKVGPDVFAESEGRNGLQEGGEGG